MSDAGSESQAAEFGIIKFIAWFYLIFGASLLVMSLVGARVAGMQLGPEDCVLPAIIVLGALGTLRRKNWGRWISYVFSAMMLLGVPIGTLMGGFMIYHLTKHRSLFARNES